LIYANWKLPKGYFKSVGVPEKSGMNVSWLLLGYTRKAVSLNNYLTIKHRVKIKLFKDKTYVMYKE
jgi:hypothetical protein